MAKLLIFLFWCLLLLKATSSAQDVTNTTESDQNSANTTERLRYVTTYHIPDFNIDIPGFDSVMGFFENVADQLGEIIEFIMDLDIPGLNATVSRMSLPVARAIAKLPFVRAVEADREIQLIKPATVEYSAQATETTPYGINMVGALKVDDSGVGNIKVCIIDSGYDNTHPDLIKSVSHDEISGRTWNNDVMGHGTHVAGTISAIANGKGVVGVARNGNIKLHIFRIFDDDGKSWGSDLVTAITSCVNAGAKIVSMSLGGPTKSYFEKQAFQNYYDQGILFIAAAGNEGYSYYGYPASFSSVISVAAVDKYKWSAMFSQFNDQVELSAPGVSVLSTYPGGKYQYMDGTSMACPHATGVAALVWSKFPTKTNKEIRAALRFSAEDLGSPGWDPDFGFGLVRADLAVNYLSQNSPNLALIDDPYDGFMDKGNYDYYDCYEEDLGLFGGCYDDSNNTDYPTSSLPPIWGSCSDYPSDWSDIEGDGCDDFYNSWSNCLSFGSGYRNDGLTANDVCCMCGGGATFQSSTLGGGECTDDEKWVDSEGDGCDYYTSKDEACALYGTGFKNENKTASDACCICKGVITTTISSLSKDNPRTGNQIIGTNITKNTNITFEETSANGKNDTSTTTSSAFGLCHSRLLHLIFLAFAMIF